MKGMLDVDNYYSFPAQTVQPCSSRWKEWMISQPKEGLRVKDVSTGIPWASRTHLDFATNKISSNRNKCLSWEDIPLKEERKQ